jgi:predicted nucleic acid-binding protein
MLFWDHGGIALQRLTTDRVARAARIALELGHPLADCVYLALAIELDCDLATCDAKFHAKSAVRYPRTRMLAEYGR